MTTHKPIDDRRQVTQLSKTHTHKRHIWVYVNLHCGSKKRANFGGL